MNTTRLLAKFKRKTLRYKHWILPAAIITTTLLLTYTLLTLLSAPRPPRLKSGSGNTLYSVSNRVFSAGIGTKDGTPEISFSRGNSGVNFVLAGAAKVKPVKTSSTIVTFPSVQPGIDLVYTTLANGLKEELVVNSPSSLSSNVFLFDLGLNNAQSNTLTTGFLGSTFRDGEGNYLFHFERPFAIDSSGNRTDDVLLQIMEDKQLPGNYSLKLIVDEAWLHDPSRVYPITIDPTVVHDTTAEFATGTFNRVFDAGSGSNPRLESYYQELVADEYTVGLWHLNEASGNALDSSGNGYTGTPTGTSVVTGLLNNGRSFNGSSYIATSLDAQANQLFATTNVSWTVETWFNTTSSSGMLVGRGGGTGASATFALWVNASGELATVLRGTAAVISTGVNDGAWHHAAVTWNGNAATGYVDGRPVNLSVGTAAVQTYNVYLGATVNGASTLYTGSLDEVRISNVARSPEEIKAAAARRPSAVYTSEVLDLGGANSFITAWNDFSWTELGVTTGDGETLADTTGLVAQWNFNETSGTTATNNAGSCGASCNGTLTSFASTASQDQAAGTGWTTNNRRFGAGALMFDGADDHVSAGTISDLKFTGDFSLEAWVNPSGSTVGQIVSSGAASDWLYLLGGSTATSPICKIYQANSGNGYLQADGKTPITDGKWHHVVCTLSGNTLSVYIDGKLDAQSSATAGTRDVSSAGTFTIGRFTNATSSYYSGSIDSFRAYSRAITASEILSNYQAGQIEFQTRVGDTTTPDDGSWEAWAPISGETQINNLDTADDSLVSYWPFEEYNVSTTHDRISSNHGTVTGATQIISRHNRGYNFTDGNDYITVSDHASLDITGDFTLMAWVYRTGGSNGYIISKFDTTGGGGYSLLHGNSGEVYCRTDNGSSYTDSYTTTGHVTTSTGWTHVTAVRSGSSCQVYINGTNQTSVSNTHTTVTANAQPFKMGANASDNSSPFYGYMDEVRVFNDALSQAEILHYMGSSTAYDQLKNSRDAVIKMEGNASLKLETGALKVDPNTVALWKFDETSGSGAFIKDSSTNALHITPTGTNSVKGVSQRGRNFNGTSDYMYTPTSMAIPTGDFTYEAWIKPDTTNDEMLFMASDGTGVNEFFVFLTSTDKVQVVTNGVARLTTTTAIVAGQWQHLVVTRSGSTITAYINGIADATTGTDGVAMAFGACGLLIGTDADTGCDGTLGNWFDGIIDEVRVSNTAKNAVEINEIYRAGRDHYFNSFITSTDLSGKTTLPFYVAADRPGSYLQANIGETPFSLGQPDSNTVGLWRLDEKSGVSNYIRDSSGNSLNGTPTGTSHVEGKVGKARYFNNTSDYITLSGSATSFNINTYSYSAWVNPTVLGAVNHFILDNRDAASDGSIMYINNTDLYTCQHNGINAADTTTVTLNKWTHIACVSDGSTIKIYIDGVLKASTAIATSISITTDAKIGTRNFSTPTGYFAGTIDELRFDKTARTADDIRQAYEYGMGLRSHPITIDFAADLDSGNLIADSNDLSFTVDATTYGLNAKGSMLFPGDKIIVKENYDGTQYQAQGTVTGVTASTGAVTVASWDSGSTFPSGGYTVGATVFKWQREYWNHRGSVLDSHIDGITQLSLRLTDGNEGRTIWLDDFKSSGGYLTNPAGSTITSSVGERYFQYRAVISSSDEAVSPQLSAVTVDYDINVAPNTPSLDAPTDTATNQSLTPTFQTTTTDNDTDYLRYRIEVCENVGMTTNCQTYDQTSSQTGWSGQNAQTSTAYTSGTQATYVVQTPLSAGTTYYWRSSAIDPAGTNTWGSTQVTPYSFTTTTAPSAPTTPWAEGATNPTGIIDLTPEFSAIHNDSDGDPAVYYEIEVNTNNTFSGTVMWDSNQTAMASLADGVRSTDVSYAGSALSWGTTYYWRIRFTDDLGAVGSWSATQNFTTNSYATSPSITSPLDGAIKVGLTPTITLASTDPDSDYLRYRLQICEDLAMTTNCLSFDQTSSQTSWSGQDAETSTAYASGTTASYTLLSNLAPNTPYYLHAGAIDPGGTNTWTSYSSVISFTTRALNEGFHCLIEETAIDSSLTVTWTDRETNEDNYILQRNVNGGGFSLYQTLSANTTSYQDTSISQGNTYQYRVAPYTIAGDATGQWCTTNTLSLESGLFNFSGLNFSGLNLN